VCCSVLQCVAVCCSVLQCVAVCCSYESVWLVWWRQSVAVCCSVLQSFAMCCSVIACITAYLFVWALSCSYYDLNYLYLRDLTHSYVQFDSFICTTWLIHMFGVNHSVNDVPPAPMNHVKIFKGCPPRDTPSKLVQLWYKSFPPDQRGLVEMKNPTRLSNKTSNAWSCAEDQILENKNLRNMIFNICTGR